MKPFPDPHWQSVNQQMAALLNQGPAAYPSIARLKAVPAEEKLPSASDLSHQEAWLERQMREGKA